MDRLVFTSNATIKEQATARQVLVNDLANVSTVGFKSSYDVALQSVKVEGPGFDSRYQATAVARDQIRLTPGPVMATGRPMDIALAEKSVLTVQAPLPALTCRDGMPLEKESLADLIGDLGHRLGDGVQTRIGEGKNGE